MKNTTALALALTLAATAAPAATFNFSFTFDGEFLTNDAGTDTVAGTMLEVGDTTSVIVSAANDDFFRVEADLNDSFIPLSFAVDEVGDRIVSSTATFFLDGLVVNSITETSVSQMQVHFGAQLWSIAAGLEFDQVILDTTLEEYDTSEFPGEVTTLSGGANPFFGFGGDVGFFPNLDNVSYNLGDVAAVPLPAAGLLMLGALGAIGGLRRKERKAA